MEWIITAKITGKDGYDVLSAFNEMPFIDWHKSKVLNNIRKGDIVYIYVGRPYSRIMLKMLCIMTDVPVQKQMDDSTYYNNQYLRNYIGPAFRLEKMKKLDDDKLSVSYMRNHGYIKKGIQGSYKSENYPALFKYINDCFSEDAVEKEYYDLRNSISEIGEKYSEAMIKTRIGQGAYRDALIEKYDCRCMLCGISIKSVLVASHIKEFSASTKVESIDTNNGLLLCANHDKLFDQHLISFDRNGDIMISHEIDESQYDNLNIAKSSHIDIDSSVETYMQYHREQLNEHECEYMRVCYAR